MANLLKIELLVKHVISKQINWWAGRLGCGLPPVFAINDL